MTKNSVAAAPSVVRLSGPGGLVAAVPMYLGFHPTNSLVLLCLRAPRGRVGPVVRVDLFPPELTDPIDQFVGCASRYADAAVVVCYYTGGRPPCLDAVLAALQAAAIPLTMVLSVRDGVIRDAASAAAERADPGSPVPGADDEQSRLLATASALAGRNVLPSREALRRSIAPPVGKALAQARGAIRGACERLAADVSQQPAGSLGSVLPDRMDDTFRRAMVEHARLGGVTPPTAAELIVLAGDLAARDRLLSRAAAGGDPDVVPLLISVVCRCPDEDAPEICSVLAVVAYRFGDGALAQCAVDRVLQVRPQHRLAHLMLSAMAAGLPPQELASMADITTGAAGSPRRR